MVAALVLGVSPARAVITLSSRAITLKPAIPDSLIVGRAACNDTVWLLSENRELTEISPAKLSAATRPVQGFRRDDRPWGLACLSDHTLWTLADSRSLARIAPGGQIAERIPLARPAIALFAVGDRLLRQSAPPIVGTPLLGTSPPRHPGEVQPWPGLVARGSNSPADFFAQNLVNCGLATGAEKPCWFTDGTLVMVSNGAQVRGLSLPFIQAPDIDRVAPIRDLALANADRAWVLATSLKSAGGGRRSGSRLFLAADGRELARLDIAPAARLIIAADPSTCLLLTVEGEWLEVSVR